MINRTRYSQRTLAVAIVGALFISALAGSNLYDKYRNRTYSNKGYLSEEDEMNLAEQIHEELQKQARLVQDPSINEYVNSVGQRLARNSGRPNIPYHFYVVDDKSINAFATLGGRVYVNTGLLAATNSEAQLASVLGHEIGHIVGRHGLENVKRAQKYGTLAQMAQAAVALLGFVAILFQINEIRSANQTTSARQAFLGYTDLAFKTPKFAQPDFEAIKAAGRDGRVQYETFVTYFLYACEEAISAFANRGEWQASCDYDLRPHLPFLCEKDSAEPAYLATYGAVTQQWVKSAMKTAANCAARLQAAKDVSR